MVSGWFHDTKGQYFLKIWIPDHGNMTHDGSNVVFLNLIPVVKYLSSSHKASQSDLRVKKSRTQIRLSNRFFCFPLSLVMTFEAIRALSTGRFSISAHQLVSL